MNTRNPVPNPELRRAAIRRTAWVLAAVALLSYGLFLYTAMAPK